MDARKPSHDTATAGRHFRLVLIKPSHYDDDGYVIQWRRALIPSNSLSSVYGLAMDLQQRRALGEDVELTLEAYDETNVVVPIAGLAREMSAPGAEGLVCLVGVQSNQFPRAVDIARQFRERGVQVAIGGFHVSGCLAMLDELPADIVEAQALGITLFAGEAEGRLQQVLADALERRMPPLYDFMNDLPGLASQPTPFLPETHIRRYGGSTGCFDAGRGCPFTCSFCTIINVQGRKSRHRDADDIERLVREHYAQGVHRFFITDDNFARNKHWEAIFDRLIELREREGIKVHFMLQVDTLCHKIKGFVEKAAKAGCTRVFIGLENVNPENLKAAKKGQNRITEYRRMLQAWRAQKVLTYCGYIIGFPGDTPESVMRDIDIVKRELPVDLLEFFILTPLPGSADHQAMVKAGKWLEPDMNVYDLEHVTCEHPRMSREELQATYDAAWDAYYDREHVRTLMLRARATGMKAVKFVGLVLWFHGSLRFEKVHPLQGGIFRIKVRTQRRHGLPRENPLLFYPRRVLEMASTWTRALLYYRSLKKLCREVEADPASLTYMDDAIRPVDDEHEGELDMYNATDAARGAVAKAKRVADAVERSRASHEEEKPRSTSAA